MPAAKSRSMNPVRTMCEEHKVALAAGRESVRALRNHLEALESARPRRGRRRTRELIEKRLVTIDGFDAGG